MNQARYWILTIPYHEWGPIHLPDGCTYIRGQLERGESTGYLHWQLLVHFASKRRLAGVKQVFGTAHCEPAKSMAAKEYVWKDETSVTGTRFELGKLPVRRGNDHDWERVRELAKSGNLDDVPGDLYVRYYGNLKRINQDHLKPIAIERTVEVYWGPTGVGKSRRAWELAGLDAYPKDPRSKFWDGYRGQNTVVIDEFRGGIDIAHLLRWFDRYPVNVEIKGSSVTLNATKIYITSNLDPRQWYPELDEHTRAALMRRLTVTYCPLSLY
jgi:hypothetical protein